MEAPGPKPCNKCLQKLPISSFSKCKGSPDGLRYTCKTCANKENAAFFQTFTGCLSRLLSNAQLSAKDRGEKGREDAGVCEITEDDLEKKFEEQDGKCFYSGIELRTDTRAWKMSLERKDPSLGYTYDNTVLCCLEFNGRCQWSQDEIRRLVYLNLMKEQGKDHFEFGKTFDIAPKERKKWTPPKHEHDANGNIVHRCTHCAEYKPAAMFNETIKNGCKACQRKKNADRRAAPRGAMLLLVDRARARTKNWKEANDPRGGDADFELSFDVVKKLYDDQKGRCAYSGLPLDFGTQRRKPSLERRDPRQPYTKENVCLIWMAWNTMDHAATTTDDDGNSTDDDGNSTDDDGNEMDDDGNEMDGDGNEMDDDGNKTDDDNKQGWNEKKFEYAMSHILAKVKKEFEDEHGGAPMTMDEFKIRFIAEYESKINV